MYRISNERLVSRSGSTLTVEAELIVDASTNIPAYDAITDRILVPGSIAIIPDESSYYMLNFSNQWVKWEAGTV
jgi:hypothetical protein